MLCENGRTVQKSLDLVHAVPDRVLEILRKQRRCKCADSFYIELNNVKYL